MQFPRDSRPHQSPQNIWQGKGRRPADDDDEQSVSTDVVGPIAPGEITPSSVAIQDRLAIQINTVNALQKNVDNVLTVCVIQVMSG